MGASRVAQAVGLLAAMAVFGVFAATSTPEGSHGIGIWPVGVATVVLMLAPRPRTPVLLAVIALIAVGSLWVGGFSTGVALGLGLGLAAEAAVAWWILAGGRHERAPLRTSVDLARFLAAVAVGALVVASCAAVTSVVTGWGDPGRLALSVGTSSLVAQLTIVPLFC
ncbi:MAG TPA: hypothetical protein VGE43_08565, partial [Acidimicrobiales bacterium]